MSDLVGNPEYQFSRVVANFDSDLTVCKQPQHNYSGNNVIPHFWKTMSGKPTSWDHSGGFTFKIPLPMRPHVAQEYIKSVYLGAVLVVISVMILLMKRLIFM